MGIDYGTRRIGIAVSDLLGYTAQPLEVIQRTALAADLGRIAALVTEYGVTLIVLGLPLNMDGTPGMLTGDVEAFAAALREKTGLPVELYDERMTTMQVDRMLTEEADVSRDRRKQVRDKLAATLILQSYLDSHPQT
jgi:putative Holliday junction resolvase